jgi:small nuclear ribonucleoprotein B and B'
MSRKGGKMLQWINYRVRVTLTDGRQLVGNLLAFDKHMNVVLSDTEEFRRVKSHRGEGEREQKRTIGMLLLRGDSIVSITAEAPPPPQARKTGEGLVVGRAQPVGRGIPVVPTTQQGPPPGLGAPPVPSRPPPSMRS